MNLTRLEISGFKSFAKKTTFDFDSSVVAIVGPNGSGKSNVAEAIRFVLGEQSMKSMRGKRGEDMIWNGSQQVPRMSRAAVALTFDNRSKFLDVDFDEVVLERVVHRDGTNEYKLNNSTVRLKDIVELLARANIGQTGHHIISQGEADKILAATARDRKEMLEDALGLKVFQYKKEESVRKLDKTQENMRQVEALRREVQPHVRFLKRQVDKLQKAEELRVEAMQRYQTYFAHETHYVSESKVAFEKEKAEIQKKLEGITQKIREARTVLSENADSKHSKEIVALSEELDRLREKRVQKAQDVARVSGQLDALSQTKEEHQVPQSALERVIEKHESGFMASGSLEQLQTLVRGLVADLRNLLTATKNDDSRIGELEREQKTLKAEEGALVQEEEQARKKLDTLRTELDNARTEERDQERALFTLTTDEKELRHQLELIGSKLETVSADEIELKRELGEVAVLVGRAAVDFGKPSASPKERKDQLEEKRELQKIKIRLEEMGAAGGEDVMKEYQEVTEREEYLEKELNDLRQSATSLQQLISELEEELNTRFKEGIKAINAEFSRFFGLMFDGGSAQLVLVKETARRVRSLEDEDDNGVPDDMEKIVEGIELSLSIPRKRIKSLVMLSGGERALTSIALIFAMSSVNPPPFLVLDETDAALDEANSRRYGEMITALSEKSQLALITHNRETMSRAGILYGVTMGNDGVSKVLSVKLEEAVAVAK